MSHFSASSHFDGKLLFLETLKLNTGLPGVAGAVDSSFLLVNVSLRLRVFLIGSVTVKGSSNGLPLLLQYMLVCSSPCSCSSRGAKSDGDWQNLG